ncbi:MAG: type II secretion system F family protein, partial [Planctomycetales bacterium]|nr:type II secretion system F family protein [Planctomycetales bacterium]
MNAFANDRSTAVFPDWNMGPADAAAPSTGAATALRFGRAGASLNRQELADMTAQLAIMMRSGVDIATALQSLVRQCRRPSMAQVLSEVLEAVEGGRTFSQALELHERSFGPTYVATVAAGEASGQMAHVLAQLAQLLRGELRLARTVRSLLAYPVLLASVSSLVIVALVLFVLPQFAAIFEQYETPLPALTRALLFFASELRSHWWLYGPLGAAAIVGLAGLRLSESGRRLWDWCLLHAWLIREVCRMLLVGRACRLLGMMIENGIPLLDALRLVRQALSNSMFVDLFDRLEDDVLNGRGLSATLIDSPIVPASAGEMIATAERSGKLGEVTRLIGEHFEEEGEAKLRQIVAV